MAEYVVVDKERLEADLTTVADAIREKSGTTEDLDFPLGMKEVVESIDTSKEEQEKTISITENGTTEVTPDEGKVLSKVTVNTNVESGGGSGEEFVGIKYSDFDSVRGNPRVADARSLPILNEQLSGGYPFLFACFSKNANGGWHSHLEDVYLPDGIKAIYVGMFYYAGTIPKIHGDLSNVETISGQSYQWSAINKFDYYLPSLKSIGANAFAQCTNFEALALKTNNLVSLGNVTAFTNTPISKGTGYIYVPRALLEDYKVSTNWATYANQFRALEDYTVNGTITGELDESKI